MDLALLMEDIDLSEIHKCRRFLSENTTYAYMIPGTPITVKMFTMAMFLLIFLIFLIVTLPNTIKRFKRAAGNRSIRLAYYILIWSTLFVRILRIIALWIIPKSNIDIEIADSVIQIILRSFMFTVEISIIIFMYHGIKRTKNIIKRVVIESLFISVFFTVLLTLSNWLRNIALTDGYIGPTIFWVFENAFFVIIYTSIIIMRFCSPLSKYLPHRVTYYIFIYFLLFCHSSELIGHFLTAYKHSLGYCFLSVGSFGYYILLLPLVYVSFLWRFLHQRIDSNYEQGNISLEGKYDSEEDNDADDYDTINSVNLDYPDILISNSSTQSDMKDFSTRIGSILSQDSFSSNQEYTGL